MADKLAKKLAEPSMYDEDNKDEATVWQKKYSEVMEAQARAETLWMRALEKLERAEV
jgi:ATP-binding cassette subfamily F protein 3